MTRAFRTPDARFENLPDFEFQPRYVDQDGLRLHYVDEGHGDPVLFLHGEPTWSFMYRNAITRVAGLARAVAPDYFGFGRSDKPVEPGWYSYDAQYRSIERFVDELGLTRMTIVVHDWGGPIGFRLAVERPELISRLVVLNTGIGAGRAPSDEWLRFREFVRRVGTELRPGRLVRVSCAHALADEIVAAYDAPFPTPEAKTGPLAFPELVPTELDHPSAAEMLAVRERLSRLDVPSLVLFGADDPIFPPRAAERMAKLLPGALPPETIAGAGHFVAEDAGATVADRIVRFLESS